MGLLGEISRHFVDASPRRKILYLFSIGMALGATVQAAKNTFDCLDVEHQELSQCADLQLFDYDVTPLMKSLFVLEKSEFVSVGMREQMLKRQRIFSQLMNDPNVDVFWFQAKEDWRKGGKTWYFDTKDGKTFYEILYPKSDKFTAEDGNTLAHESLGHLTHAYQRYLETGSVYRDGTDEEIELMREDEEYRDSWLGDYFEAIARREGFPTEINQAEYLETFGQYSPEVVYELDRLGFDADSPLFRYIFDRTMKYIKTHKKDDNPISRFVHENLTSEETRKKLQRMDKKWINYPTKGSKDWRVLQNLINQGLVDESFMPQNKPENHNDPISPKGRGFASRGNPITTRGF